MGTDPLGQGLLTLPWCLHSLLPLPFYSLFLNSSELCSCVPASPWAASFLAGEVKLK